MQCFPTPLIASSPFSSMGATHHSMSGPQTPAREAIEMMCLAPGRARKWLRHAAVLAVLNLGIGVGRNPRPDAKDNPCNIGAGMGRWTRLRTWAPGSFRGRRSSPDQGNGTVSSTWQSISSCQGGEYALVQGVPYPQHPAPLKAAQLPSCNQAGILKSLWRDFIIVHYVTATNVSDLGRC